MNYNHLTIDERCCIREYYIKGYSFRYIAMLIGRSASTISREIRRNKTHFRTEPTYFPYTAQKKYLLRRSFCHRGGNISDEAKEYIESKLKITWSPEQISKAPCEYNMPSFKTIYRWIKQKILVDGNVKYLRRKRKPGAYTETRGKINYGKTIRKRPRDVYKRKEFGHWEADTVVSGIGKSKVCFCTLAERKSRYYIAVKMPNREAKTMAKTIIETLSKFPSELVKTITCDRGKEFANWEQIENELHCEVYFADPYCAWQKGTNENSNGLLREFYPKGMNLTRVSPKTLAKNLALINARPRKVNNFISAADMMKQAITLYSSCCT